VPSNMQNQNSPEYIDKIKTRLFENLRLLPCAPGVQMQQTAEDAIKDIDDDIEEDNRNPDQRFSIRDSDKMLHKDNDYYDDEDAGDDKKHEQSHKRILAPANRSPDADVQAKKSKMETDEVDTTFEADVQAESAKISDLEST